MRKYSEIIKAINMFSNEARELAYNIKNSYSARLARWRHAKRWRMMAKTGRNKKQRRFDRVRLKGRGKKERRNP